MEPVNLHDFYSGGYFIIRAGNPGWEQLKTELLPDIFISLSQCITNRFNMSWGWNPEGWDNALDFGIPETKRDMFTEWYQKAYPNEIDWSAFQLIDSARSFVQQFFPETTDVHIIGAGLPRVLAKDHWLEPTDDLYGVRKRIRQHLPLEQGGTPLGYEIVCFSSGDLAHSWLCSGINQDIHELYGICPNALGLIDRYDEAKKVYDWIAEDEMKGHRAEPEPYDVWLLEEYPILN